MTSIHCTDCPNFDESEPTICCSTVIRPKRPEGVVGYYFPPRAKNVPLRSEPKNNEGLFVPRKEYFEHENWGNS